MINILNRIAKLLFGIYGVLIFIVCIIVACLSYVILFALVKKEKAPFVAHKIVSRHWANALFVFYFIRVKVKNSEYIDREKTYVFVGNHRSLLDIPAYAVSMKNTIRFLAKVELTKVPLLGWVINKLYIAVDRKDKAARARSMENMMNSVRQGISVFICPEGTRNKTSQPLLPFHDGAFRLAIQAQIPIAALVVLNSDKLLSPQRPAELSTGQIICQWCKPVETKGMTQDDIPALKEIVMKQMLAHL